MEHILHPDSAWVRFRVATASAITPHQVAQLFMTPFTPEVEAVLKGIVRIANPEPLHKLVFEFSDHLEASMGGASTQRGNILEYHAAIACALLEYKILDPEQSVFEAADPLGLLLLSAVDYPHRIPGGATGLSAALENLSQAVVEPNVSQVLTLGLRLASLLLGDADHRNEHFDMAGHEVRNFLKTQPIECGVSGTQFWAWLSNPQTTRQSTT